MLGGLPALLGQAGPQDLLAQLRSATQVREVDALESFARTVRKIKITFSGFGLRVAVSPPPASRTYIP